MNTALSSIFFIATSKFIMLNLEYWDFAIRKVISWKLCPWKSIGEIYKVEIYVAFYVILFFPVTTMLNGRSEFNLGAKTLAFIWMFLVKVPE